MTLKEIREQQLTKFSNLQDKQLLEAYGTVNVFKKEFTDLEKDIKDSINTRREAKSGFDKPVQLTLSFPSGSVEYTVAPSEDKAISLDISEQELYKLMKDAGLNPDDYFKIDYSITKSRLSALKYAPGMPLTITGHIREVAQDTLVFKSKKEGN